MNTMQTCALLWTLAVTLTALVLAPALFFRRQSLTSRLVHGCAFGCCFWICTVIALGLVRCINPLALLLVSGTVALLAARQANGKKFREFCASVPDDVLDLFHRVRKNRHWLLQAVVAGGRVLSRRVSLRCARVLSGLPWFTFALLAVLVGIATMTVSKHMAGFNSLRLSDPEAYLLLLRTRELSLSNAVLARPILVPSLTAVMAALSGTDASAALKILTAFIPIALTLTLGRVVFQLTRSLLASSVSMYCLGVASVWDAVTPFATQALGEEHPLSAALGGFQGPPLEAATALLLLLLWLAALLETRRSGQASGIGILATGCACALLASAPALVIGVPLLGALVLSRWPRTLLAACAGLALLATSMVLVHAEVPAPELITCAFFLACFLLGLLTFGVELLLVYLSGPMGRLVPGVTWVLVAAAYLPPHPQAEQPLEYEAVTQNASRIAQQFPHHRWMIAAPVEQLAEVYSLGSFEDLAELVRAAHDGDLSHALPPDSSYDNLFIFVEKAPFNTFSQEPSSVAFPTLTDSTYRYYRSPAGRASLEARVMALCESYRHTHNDLSIHFEDNTVLIYRLQVAHEPLSERASM